MQAKGHHGPRREMTAPGLQGLGLTGLGLVGLGFAGLGLASQAMAQDAPSPGARFGPARQVATLEDQEIDESSGIAASRLLPGAFWTHNDSGDGPRLFLFEGATGRGLATVTVEGAQAFDWEDMASFRRGREAWLLVGDVGDNDSRRPHVTLYLLREPALRPPPVGRPALALTAPVARRFDVRFADGPHDCEAVAVDVTDPEGPVAWLVTKERARGVRPNVYRLPLFDRATGLQTLEAVAQVQTPGLVTAGDMSPDGRRLLLLHYRDAYLFERAEDEAWPAALGRRPVRVPMPRRKQGEALAFDDAGRSLWLTSEGLPTPVWEVPPAAEPEEPGPAPDPAQGRR